MQFLKCVGLALMKAFSFKITSDILLHMISKLWHLLVNAATAFNNLTNDKPATADSIGAS